MQRRGSLKYILLMSTSDDLLTLTTLRSHRMIYAYGQLIEGIQLLKNPPQKRYYSNHP